MAAITITEANVNINAADSTVTVIQFGEAVSAGETIYLDSGDSKYYLSANTSASASSCSGVALKGGAADGYGILIPTGQSYVVGGTVAVGEIYVVGGAGEIVPIGDLVSTNWVTILGTGISTTEIELNVKKSNIQKA